MVRGQRRIALGALFLLLASHIGRIVYPYSISASVCLLFSLSLCLSAGPDPDREVITREGPETKYGLGNGLFFGAMVELNWKSGQLSPRATAKELSVCVCYIPCSIGVPWTSNSTIPWA